MPESREDERPSGKIGEQPEETTRADAPPDTGNQDEEPEADEIPQSAKAIIDYHDGLSELSEAGRYHHGNLLDEAKKNCKVMEHPELKEKFNGWIQEHEDHLNKMLDGHARMCKDMQAAFEQHHPNYEALHAPTESEQASTEKTKVPEDTKPTAEPRDSRKPQEDRETGPGKSGAATTPCPPLSTKENGPMQMTAAQAAYAAELFKSLRQDLAEIKQREERERVGTGAGSAR